MTYMLQDISSLQASPLGRALNEMSTKIVACHDAPCSNKKHTMVLQCAKAPLCWHSSTRILASGASSATATGLLYSHAGRKHAEGAPLLLSLTHACLRTFCGLPPTSAQLGGKPSWRYNTGRQKHPPSSNTPILYPKSLCWVLTLPQTTSSTWGIQL